MSIELPIPDPPATFLAQSAFGVGAIALAHLLQQDGAACRRRRRSPARICRSTSKPRQPHFAPKAKAMISLFMHGGPSHVDLLDPKPELTKHHGTEYGGDVVFSFVNRASKKLFGSPWKFAKHGQCGTEVSELLPHTAGIVDDICVIRSMHTGHNGHEVSIRYFHGGIAGVTGRPTMGSWIVYGLGSESQELPAYMVLSDPAGHPVDGTHQLVERLHAAAVSGHRAAPAGAADPQPRPAAALARRARSGRTSTLLDRLNRRHLRQPPGRGRPGGPDRQLRAGRRHADGRQGSARHLAASRRRSRRLYGLDQTRRRANTARAA